MSPVLGLFRFDLYGKTAYLYALAVLFVWFVIACKIVKSPFGRSLDGIRQSPPRMRAIGTPVWWRLVAIYAISAAMAGTAGALSAQTTRFVGLNTLGILISGIAVVMLVLGGTHRLYGAFLGATIYVVVQDYAAKVNPFYWMFVIGVLLMGTVLFLENGLMGLLDKIRILLREQWRRIFGGAQPS
jgi:branched-chain amino acid transport system permease protein